MAPEEAKGRAAFDQELAYYKANREALLKEYRGKWVAILNQTVVDSDMDFSPLAKRVYEKHGYRPILITRVEDGPQVVNVPSPRIARR
jgi:hypothetical protein